MLRAANARCTKPRSRAICCGEIVSATAVKRPPGPPRRRKSRRRPRQQAEPRAAARAEQLDAPDPAVLVGVELDRDLAGRAGRRAFGHLDDAAGAANAQGRGRRLDLHVAGLGHLMRGEGDRAAGDLEQRRIVLAAVLVDELVHGDAGVGGEIECRLVVEGDAERRGRAGAQQVALEDRVLDLQAARRAVAGRRRVALDAGDVADLVVAGLRGLRVLVPARGVCARDCAGSAAANAIKAARIECESEPRAAFVKGHAQLPPPAPSRAAASASPPDCSALIGPTSL